MSEIFVPEELNEVGDDDLTELGESITARAEELREADLTDEVVSELESLSTGFERVQAEQAARTEARDALTERRESLLSGMSPQAEAPDLTVVDGEGETADPDAEVAQGEVVEEAEGIEQVAAAVNRGLRPGERVEAQLNTRPRGSRLTQKMNALREQSGGGLERPSVDAEALQAHFTATVHAPGLKEGTELTMAEVANAITRKRQSFSSIPEGVRDDRISLATATMPFPDDQVLTGDKIRNFSILQSITRQAETLVASGSSCAPLTPLYDIFRLATPHSPVESNLPVAGGARGGISWINPPALGDAEGGIGTTTNAEAADLGTGSGQTLKPCITVDCPETTDLYVTAVSQCVLFDNLGYRVFPEQVQAFLEDLAWYFASTKEILYLDRIEAGSTAVTTTQAYGATRSMLRDALQAATGYRLRNGMDIDAPLDWYVPVWASELIKADMVADNSMGMGFLTATTAQVASALRDLANLSVTFVYDGSTAEPEQAMRDAQSAGALNSFPTDAVTYMHAPGTFFRIDAGTLDVGLTRDSTLNQTNDLQLFSEQWVEAGKAGIEGLKITHGGVCPTGEAPAATDNLLSC